jgi:hypothetical protein
MELRVALRHGAYASFAVDVPNEHVATEYRQQQRSEFALVVRARDAEKHKLADGVPTDGN